MIAKKKYAAVFTVFMFLTSLAMVSVPVQSSSPRIFYVAGETISAKPAGTKFWVDILINASDVPFWDPEGIVGWGLFVQVNASVLKPVNVKAGYDVANNVSYFLWKFANLAGYPVPTLIANIDNVTGLVDVSEQIAPTPALGGATIDPWFPAPQMLVSIQFESLSLHSDTTIDIITPEYMDAYTIWHAVDDGDGYYEGFPEIPVGANLVARKGWAEHHRFVRSRDGDINVTDSHGTPGVQTLYAKIKNVGDVNLTVRALFRMTKGAVPRPMVVSNEVFLEPGEVVIVQGDASEFSDLGYDDGQWTLDAFCEYYFADVWNLGATVRTTRFVVLA